MTLIIRHRACRLDMSDFGKSVKNVHQTALEKRQFTGSDLSNAASLRIGAVNLRTFYG